MFSDPTGFSETIDLTQQTLDFLNVGGRKTKSKIFPSDTLVTR